jgi:hypothetical protein
MDQRTMLRLGGALLLALLIGFLPPWLGKRRAERALAETRLELELSREQGRLGAALTEALRSNYERSRQLMAGYFTQLQATAPQVDAPRRRELNAILAQRDEIITMLSRAQPETAQRLMLIYTSMFATTDPQGMVGSTVTPPPPPAGPATGPSDSGARPAPAPATAPGPAPAAPRVNTTPVKPPATRDSAH